MIDIHTIGAGGGSIAYVDEGGAFGAGHIGGPLGVRLGVPDDFAVLPDLSWNERTNDRNSALRASIGDEAAQVPTIGVHYLMLVRDGIINLARLV